MRWHVWPAITPIVWEPLHWGIKKGDCFGIGARKSHHYKRYSCLIFGLHLNLKKKKKKSQQEQIWIRWRGSLWPPLPYKVKGEALQQTLKLMKHLVRLSKCVCRRVTHPYSCGILMTDDFISWLPWMSLASSGRGSVLIGLYRSWASPCSSKGFVEWTVRMWNNHQM